MVSTKMFDLSGRVAVVTGGNGGIGRGIALGLGQAGCAVAVLTGACGLSGCSCGSPKSV
jgi:2-dehydro-3-deoxy-D-gluconate 5-dehydrogenase